MAFALILRSINQDLFSAALVVIVESIALPNASEMIGYFISMSVYLGTVPEKLSLKLIMSNMLAAMMLHH
jgi:hypothetical protein